MTIGDFIELVVGVLGEPRRPNHEQSECLATDPKVPLLIAAGPGTGKTTVLVLRALRHVLVDQVPPQRIMITTFTRKAAKEIRSRLIEWGTPLIEHLLSGTANALEPSFEEFLRDVDINRFVTGTLDSLCEEALSDARQPGERPPTVIETFAANQLLSRRGKIFEEARTAGQPFKEYLGLYTNTDDAPQTLGDMTRVVRNLVDRFVQDEVDLAEYAAAPSRQTARNAIIEIYKRYTAYLADTNQLDFATLERAFLDRLVTGQIPELIQGLDVLLVDEYQDTNPLQEHIYFELAKLTGASLTVVGDDDQSLYRFRGATIELFRDFIKRTPAVVGKPAATLRYLTENYRSTPEIVTFFNSFIRNDDDFKLARIEPPKPSTSPSNRSNGIPVLGMFRPSSDVLATDLADFLHLVFRRGGRPGDGHLPEPLRCAAEGGDLGDAVLIAHTVSEFRRDYMGHKGKPRFPWLLRQELQGLGIECFNPRGRALKDIREVKQMLGLVLECLDPSSSHENQGRVVAGTPVTNSARDVFRDWRNEARELLAAKGQPLQKVVTRWSKFTQYGHGADTEWPVLDVLYSLMPWIEGFQDDPECQVYLEAITRCAAQAATFSGYRALILKDEPHRTRSVKAIVLDVLAPIADDLVEVDEDIMPSIPRDRLNIMTIHQAKGLEFPLVIVDISSDFERNHPKQRFRRFPENPSSVTLLEDDLSAVTPVGPLRTRRSAIQRSFEDLIRLYYVAYSRPQSVLMLVGRNKCLRYDTTIRNVATFWRRDGIWTWRRASGGGRPPSLADNIPFIGI